MPAMGDILLTPQLSCSDGSGLPGRAEIMVMCTGCPVPANFRKDDRTTGSAGILSLNDSG